MLRSEASTTIKRPVDEVFAMLSDWTKAATWISGNESVTKTSDGPTGVGTTWHSTSKLFGRRMDADTQCTEFEPNRGFAFAVTKPFAGTVRFALEAAAGGTRVDQTIDAEPGGFFKLAQPVLAAMMKRQVQADLDTFRDLMEADAL